MTMSPGNERKINRRQLAVVRIVFALMLFIAIVPVSTPAMADCIPVCDAPVTTLEGALKIITQQGLNLIGTILGNLFGASKQGFDAISAAVVGSATIGVQANAQIMQFKVNADIANMLQFDGARAQAAATMSKTSVACSVIRYEAASERLGQHDNIGPALIAWVNKACQGPNADCSGPGRIEHLFNNLCQLGMISQADFGTQLQACTTPQDPTRYENILGNIGLLLNQKQLEMAQGCVLQDGFITFVNEGACTQGTAQGAAPYNQEITQDQGLWAAFFLVCETLYEAPTCSYFNGDLTQGAEKNIMDCQAASVPGGAIMRTCLMALGDRTAVPNTATAQAVGGTNETMHDDQVEVCNTLKQPASPVSAGFNYTDDTQVLPTCDQTGLSIMYRDSVKHHCSDKGHMAVLAQNTNGDDAAFSKELAECGRDADAYNASLKAEDTALATTIGNAIQDKIRNPEARLGSPSGIRPDVGGP